jgi:hypothetical protein
MKGGEQDFGGGEVRVNYEPLEWQDAIIEMDM